MYQVIQVSKGRERVVETHEHEYQANDRANYLMSNARPGVTYKVREVKPK